MSSKEYDALVAVAREHLRKVRAKLASLFVVSGEAVSPRQRLEIACQLISQVEELTEELRDAATRARERMETFASKHELSANCA